MQNDSWYKLSSVSLWCQKISSRHLKQCTHSGKITKIILWLELLQI